MAGHLHLLLPDLHFTSTAMKPLGRLSGGYLLEYSLLQSLGPNLDELGVIGSLDASLQVVGLLL